MAEYFKRAFFEVLFPYYCDKGQNSNSSALLFVIKVIKNTTRSACFLVLTIKNALKIIQIRDKEREVIIRKVMERSYFVK